MPHSLTAAICQLPQFAVTIGFGLLCITGLAAELEPVRVSNDGRGFVLQNSRKPFVPWGFNYDRDSTGRLLEDYWHAEWPTVVGDVHEMAELGANVIRIHLQTGRFLNGPDEVNAESLNQLRKLVRLAEEQGVYLDLTGLGCYHKQDVPAWFDELDEAGRWRAQATFWKGVAEAVKDSPAIFCLNLMNEPVAPAGTRKPKDWLGPAFFGKHYVQVIALDQGKRQRSEIAVAWTRHLVQAIRSTGSMQLITIGLVDWSLDRPGLTSGFVPSAIGPELDFLCVHLYPEAGKEEEARKVLEGFSVGKPVVIEETFPLKASPEQAARFLREHRTHYAGAISFYWGKPLQELQESQELGEAILAQWLPVFMGLQN